MRELKAAFALLALCAANSLAAAPHRYTAQSLPAPWRRFTNSIVSRIWRPPASDSSVEPVRSDRIGGAQPRAGRNAARYGQDIVLRFNVSTAAEARAIAEATEDLFLDVWEFNDNYVDIRLAKEVFPSLLGLLPASLQHAHAPLMPDSGLAEVIDKSLERPSFTPNLKDASKDLFFQDYQPLSVIKPWLELMASMFPTHVGLVHIGLSWEGRDIQALRVGVHPTNNDNPSEPRKTIIISGGLHAREWISVSTVTYVAFELIQQYGKSSTWTSLLEAFDFILIPTLNPDGYEYTWETDRLWRKNRQPTSLRFCRGIDLDRSFGFQWDGDASGGNPCSESYAGDEPWQAVEARRFADWAKNETENNNVKFMALVDLHSYSQQVLYPYSYSCAAAPPTLENLEELAMGIAKALRMGSRGHYYKTTSACEGNVAFNTKKGRDNKNILPRIERGGGSALDWFYHELNIKYAYQVKLRDMGSYGFMLPKEHIVPQGKEMMNAITYLGRYLLGEVGVELEDEDSPPVHELAVEDVDESNDTTSMTDSSPSHDGPQLAGDEDVQWELKRRRRR